jgi:hypothetical protein
MESSSEPYVPSKPARLPGRVTATSVTVFCALPKDSPEPEAWEVEYGFRYTGGWKPAPWNGTMDKTIPQERGRGYMWVCTIDGLEPESKYIVRIRARAEGWGARGLGWGDWSERSSVIATLAGERLAGGGEAAEADQSSSDFLSAAGAFLKEGIDGIRKEIASDAEPPEPNEWAAPVVANAPQPVVLTKYDTIEFRPDEGYAQVEDETESSEGGFELGLSLQLYESRSRRTTGPKPPPVVCILRIAGESVAARKPTLRPGLEVLSVMGRPAKTLLSAGTAQEEITASLVSIWRTCLELNRPLQIDFSKRVSPQWVPEPEPQPQPQLRSPLAAAAQSRGSGSPMIMVNPDDDDALAKLQRDALRISQEDSDLDSTDADLELSRSSSAITREMERLEAKMAATDALLKGGPSVPAPAVAGGGGGGGGTDDDVPKQTSSQSSEGGVVLVDADRTLSRAGASRLAALDNMFQGHQQGSSSDEDSNHELQSAELNLEPEPEPELVSSDTASAVPTTSGLGGDTGALLDQLEELAGKEGFFDH